MDNKERRNRISLAERIRNYFSHSWRICIYTLCGLGLCWIDLWRGIGNGAQWALAVNCTGFCVLPLIVFRLDWKVLISSSKNEPKWQKHLKICFYAWVIMAVVLAYPVFDSFAPNTDYNAQFATAIANAAIYGAVVIRMYFYLFYEKKEKENTCRENTKIALLFWIWLGFIVFAIVSINTAVWPLWFLVMFGSLYLAPLDKSDIEEIAEGLVNGIIIGFFWIQSRAFLYRPFDGLPRYRGHYTNENVNAMFYLFVYCAWLIKLTFYRIRGTKKRYLFTFFMASAMWSFVFFTGCRSAMLGFLGVSFFYWIAESKISEKKQVVTFLKNGFLMLICFAVSFLPVFWCIRYIPPLRHHPIWYGGEYAEYRVMSWDPIDSDKYVELDEAMSSILGRFNLTRVDQDLSQSDMRIGLSPFAIATADESVAETLDVEGCSLPALLSEDGEEVYSYADGIAPGTDELHPIYINDDFSGSLLKRVFKVRYYVYRYIFKNIHMLGNRDVSSGAWVLSYFPVYHAHNTVLQMFYWFGPISGIMFMILLISGIFCSSKLIKRNIHFIGIFSGVFLIAYFLMGLTECVAFPGEMGMTLTFISLIPSIRIIND